MKKTIFIIFIALIVLISSSFSQTNNFYWFKISNSGTPISVFNLGDGGGGSGSSDYVIYASRNFEITGSPEITGNVSLLNGKYTDIGTDHKEFIKGNLDVELFEDSTYENYKSENGVHVSGSINQVPFIPPVCCSDCHLFPALSGNTEVEVKNKNTYTISNNQSFKKINVKNGGTLILNSGSSENTLYIKVQDLSIFGVLQILEEGRVIVKISDNFDIKGNGGINVDGDPSRLIFIYNGKEFKEATGDVSAMLCFGDEVKDIKLTGNLDLKGAISAPEAAFFISGNNSISQWMYGKDFDIKGNISVSK